MRLALGLIMQETHSFSPLLTGIEEFRDSPMVPLTEGGDVIAAHRHAESEMGGFIETIWFIHHTVVYRDEASDLLF